MSSEEEDYNDVENSPTILPDSKRRRIQRACDTCRRKKSQYEFFFPLTFDGGELIIYSFTASCAVPRQFDVSTITR